MKVGVVIVCAGEGKRIGKQDKAVLPLSEKPLFYHSVNTFKKIKTVKQIVLVLRKKNFPIAGRFFNDKKVILVSGGKERKDSVYNGLRALDKNIDYALIHDGARPFVDKQVILRVLGALKTNHAVVCGIPAVDTLKSIAGGYVKDTLARDKIVYVQTPQGFKKEILLAAYAKFGKRKAFDDAQMVEYLGEKVKVVNGDRHNIKITYPQDVMRNCRGEVTSPGKYRMGLGVDLHRFSQKKKDLILGGVKIDFNLGLEAVSDGDVVLHAVCDAVCGACNLGDIGDHFPPAAKKSKNINSGKIAEFILKKIDRKFEIVNIDINLIAEKPKLSPYKKDITKSLRNIFGIKEINVKIKSKEGGSFFGGIDSISCLAVVLVVGTGQALSVKKC